MTLLADYPERVYAGVLGKMIGVYLGRPVEGWSYERISAELGEIGTYVHERCGVPLVIPDDDLSGTFTFLRALEDHGFPQNLTSTQIGETWLNYLIEERTVLWWGGLGNSSEHTAYLRLKAGIPAPESGSASRNGRILSEQIGAQIFIDGWGMVAPGDPELAVYLAGQAARVSHDGEAVIAAQVIAAMEALAFVEPDLEHLLDAAATLIPSTSTIFRLIQDVRAWHAGEPDWRQTRARIAQHYGPDRYGGNVHVVPNHALILLGLLYGENDFGRSLMITTTSGWDTDCNAANVGCLLGIKNGLTGLEGGTDWRGPVGDRLYLPTADGGRAITDALTEAYHVVNAGRALASLNPEQPKGGARFHFSLPGSVQGFSVQGEATLLNAVFDGGRGLAVQLEATTVGQAVSVSTPTFLPQDGAEDSGYGLMASPTLHSGQQVRGRLWADPRNPVPLDVRLCLWVYGAGDTLEEVLGPSVRLSPGEGQELAWQVPDTGGQPIAKMGLSCAASQFPSTVVLDWLTWSGAPQVDLGRPEAGTLWRRAWVNAVDLFESWPRWPETYRIVQNQGRGLLMQGSREWANYAVEASITPHLATAVGLAARVQGVRRYYALLLTAGGTVRLVKVRGEQQVLAEASCAWACYEATGLRLEVNGSSLRGWVNGQLVLNFIDDHLPLLGGGVALVLEEGSAACERVKISPVA